MAPIYLCLHDSHFSAVCLSVNGRPFVPTWRPALAPILAAHLPGLLFRGGALPAAKARRLSPL
eukprot:14792554-Heterocapsa_arctica.AAC.1